MIKVRKHSFWQNNYLNISEIFDEYIVGLSLNDELVTLTTFRIVCVSFLKYGLL
jgi:hypothetical protein